MGHEHGRADHEDAENRTPEDVFPDRRPAWTRLETVQSREQQQIQEDGCADSDESQLPAPFAASESGQPGPR